MYKEKELFGGVQRLYKFPNHHGASVVKHPFSYGGDEGLWELAHIVFDEEYYHWDISYEVFGDVIGYLTLEEVEGYLKKIKSLPKL